MQLLPPTSASPPPAALVQSQPRFRIDGDGPVASRSIVPVTDAAARLLAERGGADDAVRGVLRLVEDAAGGPAASAHLDVNGIAFALDDAGHGANVFAAHAAADVAFGAEFGSATPQRRSELAQELLRDTRELAAHGEAVVSHQWFNFGARVSHGLLGATGDASELANAIRIARHEAQHVADTSRPALDAVGTTGLRESLAEAHSTSLGQLQRARTLLGLDGVVDDDALRTAQWNRPYAEYERTLAQLLVDAGIDSQGATAAQVLARPAAEVAERLVAGIARTSSTSEDAARQRISDAFAANSDAPGR